MKWIMLLVVTLTIASCQTEELKVTENPDDISFLYDQELVALVRSVTSQDGTFDDRIDNANCFSIKFPYGLWVNGEQHTMTSPDDFVEIPAGAAVEPEFPITLNMSDYTEVEIPSMNVLYDYIVDCHSGDFFDDIITCVDLDYPIELSMFDSGTSDFETITLNHDWDVYSTLQSLNSNMLVTIQFPVDLVLQNGDKISVDSNQQLKNQILRIVALCN